jgi:Fe-Mn family superoxide dismutase
MFELPKLPYPQDALEPFISSKTLEFHYGKHHQTYVTNLNNLTKGTEFENADLETIVKKATGPIFNNGAQVWNHTFYFEAFSATAQKTPSKTLGQLIDRDFESLEKFKEKFNTAATTLFGSGWAWLVLKADGKLDIVQTSNAGNPLRDGHKPLLTCDVWEHAYYIDVKNRRPDYIKNFWEILDWKLVDERL